MSTSQREATIVGGPRDGEVVPWQGVEMYEPVREPLRFVPSETLKLPTTLPYKIRRYRAYQWRHEGRIEWRYVADEYAKGLGCP